MKKLDEFKCFVQVEHGKLLQCKIKPDGGVEMWAGQLTWSEVQEPTQAFLDAANQSLGTKFSLDDFGKKSKTKV